MATSKATATWEGSLDQGRGTMKPAHADEIRFSKGSRFEGQGGSNPEEVIGAALAGCFSMALSLELGQAGVEPRTIRTSAEVKIVPTEGGFDITSIGLDTEVDADLEDARFQEIAEATKKGCPVSKALAGVRDISLRARLKGA